MSGPRTDLARRAFARACERRGVVLGGGDGGDGAGGGAPLLRVHDATAYARIAESDWLGLGEAYLAGEWDSPDLPAVLGGLLGGGLDVGVEGSIGRGLRRLTRTRPKPRHAGAGGALPASLIALYAGEGLEDGSAIFATGPATTAKQEIPSHVPGAGRRGEPAAFLVDVTRYDDPRGPERADLPDAQDRRNRRLLRTAGVRPGGRVIEWPASGGGVALAAAAAGADASVLALADDHAAAIQRRARAEGLGEAVRILRSDDPAPGPREFRHDYDAVICVEGVEALGADGLRRWLRSADRVLARGGSVVLQVAVAAEPFDDDAGDALDLLRSYVWPALRYPTLDEIRRIVDRDTGLRIVGESHFGGHWAETLRLWRETFATRSREAAGLGYDQVYRRLWDYQLGLREALARTGRLDMVQLEMMPVPRRSR
ncbi:class I SAM-dependent methyltransferase [Corynebacterium sp. 335C]